MIFLYPSTWYTVYRNIQLTATDAAVSGPVRDIGPGTVNLANGEFQTSTTDASVAGLAVGRSHLSTAPVPASALNTSGVVTRAADVFGPGWTSTVAPGGAGSFAVIDQRAASASFLLQDPSGVTYVFQSTSAAASELTGPFYARGEAMALGATLVLAASGVLTYTSKDGTRTMFEKRSGGWVPTATIGVTAASTDAESTTTYYYDATGLPTWIIAPSPPGLSLTCAPEALPAGCQALHLS